VLFTSADDPDLQGDFFTKATDLELEGRQSLRALWDHGLDPVLKRRQLGRATYQVKDAGVWFETKLNEADEYEKAIYGLAKAGKLGWSTGSAPHLVERTPVKKAFELKSWPVIEVSLTHMPVEPRTAALPLKSIDHVELQALIAQEAEPVVEPPAPFTTKALEVAIAAAFDADLDTHSKAVATTVEELIAHAVKCATLVEGLKVRTANKQEFRAVKDGRAFSQQRVDKMNELIGQLKKLAEHPLTIAAEFEKMVKDAVATREQRDALHEAIQLQHNQFQQLKESQNHG
jgi:phage head maturation protease